MPETSDLLAAALADRYRVERELGRGGMATVYLARDLRHDRPVALKVLRPELAATLGPERFLREIRTTARLQHPHILPMLDSGEAAGQLWYTMPYVRGESLRDRLRREAQLPVEVAVDLARQIALALDYAHREGVIHRDLKPENILLSDQQALVADFGVAKALAAGHEGQLTETGMAVGTPAYMSPEQASAGQMDGRSDIYALGCVLYEMLAGEPPFTGPTPQAILAKRVLEPVPHVRTLRESVPEPLEQVITRALAKAPADRFATAGEFARALATPATATPSAALTLAPSSTPVTTRPQAPLRRVPVIATALGLILLLGLGMLFAWRRNHLPAAIGAGPTRLAVLPFENLGDSSQSYFADGVTDAVRDKLAGLPGLEVIASVSSNQYRHTDKRPELIGRELGVQFLLMGRVRWAKAAGGVSRVQVRPELIDVRGGAERWGEPFDAPLTDVFEVQADIAGRVAGALGLALGASERQRLATSGTENLSAYDAFLRGEEATEELAVLDPAALQRGLAYYEHAVALDSAFAPAWAQISRVHSSIYWNAPTPAGASMARLAAERALSLAPERPQGHLALGYYYELVRNDHTHALEQYARGGRLAPKDAELLIAAAVSEMGLGRLEDALTHLRRAEVFEPRSVDAASLEVHTLVRLHRYPEALTAAARALGFAPGSLRLIQNVVLVHLARGDLAAARAVLRVVPPEVDPAALVAFVATYEDLYWALDDKQQRLLLRLSPVPFGNDRASWGLALAETHALRGDTVLARAYADSARLAYAARLGHMPQSAGDRALLGVALAYLGQRVEAVREGERGVALMPVTKDAYVGAYVQHQLARTYLLVGEPEKALDWLEQLLKMPYFLSPGWLKIDPTFAPLRGNPRFERLAAEGPR